ncbi:queuine tRNA-ribosyltransferase, putative [Plasmodium gallinaceum]|uniref:Queuine tRNA-ribosyltransferase, putative n=1 Tax=Plasmodium gallinaceum TaxID=5849 RepID=A0A1J1GTK5_PLAGA|nr:queuine tRNA-ribosyltransferase, putative [Plasmodium gallinaceum]CRG95844.1 queuine tRNA-ribosyltransferase, putative [Plasmodium gallinaceum]
MLFLKMKDEMKYCIKKINDVETPVSTILTNDFLPEFINMELLRKIEKKVILNCPLFEVYNQLDVLEKAKEFFNKKSDKSKNYLDNFCDFEGTYRYMNIRNVLTNNFSININKYITLKYNNSTVVFSIDDFLKCIEIFEPNIFCIPSEEIKINEDIGKKKKIRIINLMDEFLEKIKTMKENSLHNSLCILSIPSTINIHNLITDILNKYNCILDGYLLSGIGYDESNEIRTKYLKNILNVLPDDKLKFIQLSIGNPIEILHSIFNGIDIIETNFPYYLAKNGKAINMNIKMNESNYNSKLHDINLINFKNSENFIIDLNDTKYNFDFSTITNNSPRKETKSYIHHLLKCQELTAHVILTYHNLYIYNLFFKEIQTQIKNNNFLNYISWFVENHNLSL